MAYGYVYEAPIELACWKEHACVACGCVFQYHLAAEAKGVAGARSFSTAAAEENGRKALARDVEPHPCPTCGLFQPEMVAKPRLRGHNQLFVAVLAVIFPASLAAAFELVPAFYVGVGSGILAAIAAWFQYSIARSNPNADLAANKLVAEREIRDGALQMVQPGDANLSAEPYAALPRPGLGLILVILAGPALVAPVIAAFVMGLPHNSVVSPYYVGPGDRLMVTFPRSNVNSLNGAWQGRASAIVVGQDGKGVADLKATAGQTRHAKVIRRQRFAPETSPCVLYAYVHLPNDAALEGHTVRIRVVMDVAYLAPDSRNPRFYEEKTTTETRNLDVQLGNRSNVRLYWAFWWVALVGGWCGIVAGSTLLVYHAWHEQNHHH